MKIDIRKICVGLLVASLVAIPIVANTTITPVVGADEEPPYEGPFEIDTVSIPQFRTYSIGVLQGTWEEMGTQYGQRTANDVAKSFDSSWKSILGKCAHTDPVYKKGVELEYKWPEGVVTKEEKVDYIKNTIVRKSEDQLSWLHPELIEFMEGIAEGASEELDKCEYADVCSNLDKILIINGAAYFELGLPEGGGNAAPLEGDDEEDCCGFWVKGEATKTGDTYATCHWQGVFPKPSGDTLVSYVAIPSDPNARVFWSFSWPGKVSGRILNDCGVTLLSATGQYYEGYANPDESLAHGVIGAQWCAVVFSESAEEAVERFIYGTPEYREETGRETVLRAQGLVLVFADANEAYCVEANAKHYAIREPGYMGEEDGNYLAHANHFLYKEGSFDENDEWHGGEAESMWAWTESKDVPGWVEGGWEPDFEGLRTTYEGTSWWRVWSGVWAIRNNYGDIDIEMVLRELTTLHTGYTEDGVEYPPDEDGIPTVCNTFCDHYMTPTDHHGYRSEKYPLGIGGERRVSVFNLSTLEAYWVPGWPCHYIDKEWNYLNLKPYSEYRALLYGYPPTEIEVEIDIKPATIPLKGVSKVNVAILTTDDFDAATVDSDTVRFGPDKADPTRCTFKDVDQDGDIDMLLRFRVSETGIEVGDTEATLVGKTVDGISITGTDSIRTVPKS